MRIAVDAQGHLLAVQVSAANGLERTQVRSLAQEVKPVTEESVTLSFVDQGYTGQVA